MVGIGASAGGLEAFEEFFRACPVDTGMAFVLVPHLDPGHGSLLTEILQRFTAMPVVEALDQIAVAPNHVYVIPPNREMAILNRVLQLSVPEQARGQRMPIDAFLRSLAEDQAENAIGIILSGTATDGTLGLRAIHGTGGICLVQDPATARYDGMPRSAITAGYATHVLPVGNMPAVLLDVRLDSRRLTKDGEAPTLRTVLTDITEGRRVQDALNASAEFARSLIDSMHDGFGMVDAKGVHLDVNPALCDMTGFSREELVGTGIPHPYWPPEGYEAIQAAFQKVLKSELGSVESTFMRKSGERFPVIVSPSAVRDTKGNVICYIATIKDITERKRAEDKLREMAASLDAKVTERTSQLRKLAARLTMTEERERRMLAQDLHDNLGQLLAVIKIRLSLLAAGSIQSSVNQIVELVDQAEESAQSLTFQLSPPILHTLGFVPALEWLAEEIERVFGLVVHVDKEGDLKPLAAEMQAVLYRSVRELLINVAKHAQVSEASLVCLCNGSKLTLVVSDDGCGFEPADFANILPGHHSFGLRSIYERITNLGGQMEIDSRPGNGTTISLCVPYSNAAKRLNS
ncbi:MAG: chemotaxis protein CheB [Rhodocyclaceae bacterium]|nr:chemotaxis protein CheB [Rhodocyclaceae bacterium]